MNKKRSKHQVMEQIHHCHKIQTHRY